MSEGSYSILGQIAERTGSDLIIFFIILAVMLIPAGILRHKGRKADKQHERERETIILEVIKENSTVIAGLKSTLDSSGDISRAALERIHARIDGQGKTITGIAADIAKINAKTDISLKNQTELFGKVNKIMLLVGSAKTEEGV